MLGIKYETWKNICNMYFSLGDGSTKSYLQWFPFTKLTETDKSTITSEDFYYNYIHTPSFVLFPSAMHRSENFLQKGDGSFRDSSLVSPVLYLVIQAIGKEIFECYSSQRPADVSAYYAGNYAYMRPKYKQDYDDFFKELNSYTEEYPYFIKTDVTNFFANINIDKLINQIDSICNANEVVFTQAQLHIFKELLKYCGNGRFPLIENSVSTSFLATIVYLDEIDTKLHNYISENIPAISQFHMVRYVDDMYILISSNKSIEALHGAYNEIRNEYSSILKEYGLALNTKKCCLKETKEINQELKKSLYDEYFNGKKHNIEELFPGSLQAFISDLSKNLLFDCIDVETYNKLIEKHFSSDNVEFTPSEVFNYFVYENDSELQSEVVVSEIVKLVKRSISFISLDPKRLTILIMKTKNDRAIKGFLNQLFKRNRADKWNSYDTTIAISYLIQSEFKHIDLIDVLLNRHPQLYEYYFNNCRKSFFRCFSQKFNDKLRGIIAQDTKAYYLYFMYLCEFRRKNYMAAFAYFKNYFDRVTADLDFIIDPSPKKKRPNYKAFYKQEQLIKFYSEFDVNKTIIEKAHKLRNANPLSHSSSELLDKESTTEDLKQSIEDLSSLMYDYIEIKMP